MVLVVRMIRSFSRLGGAVHHLGEKISRIVATINLAETASPRNLGNRILQLRVREKNCDNRQSGFHDAPRYLAKPCTIMW